MSPIYSVDSYGAMIAEHGRTDAYIAALGATVKPGDVVLDLGAGIGLFSLIACRYGARQVYAVEPADAIQLGREIAAANGLGDRIEFIQEISTRIELPELADVIVADLRGVLPGFRSDLATLMDARQRLLAHGGVLIPHSDSLWAAIAGDSALYESVVQPWSDRPYGYDLDAGRAIVTNQWRKCRLKPRQLLSPGRQWATLDYGTLTETRLSGDLLLPIERAGPGHGLCLWFDTILTQGVGYSNSPSAAELIYGQGFFPWPEAVVLDAGDTVAVTLRAHPTTEDYVWQWQSTIYRQGDRRRVKAEFDQSTFLGTVFSPRTMRKRANNYTPKLSESGDLDRYLLGLMDGTRTLGEMAEMAYQRFPSRFANAQEALTRLGDLAQHYST